MTTKLHKAYSKGKNAFYYFKCECSNVFIARNDKAPKSCGCLQGKPKSVDIETNTNNVEIIPKTHKNCWRCKTVLPLDSFHKQSNCCKKCKTEYRREHRVKYKDKLNEYSRMYYAKEQGLTIEEMARIKEERRLKAEENKQKARIGEIKFKELKERQEAQKVSLTKKCIKCNEIKPKSEFFKAKRKIDGYDSRCKECEKLRLRQERGHGPRRVVTLEEKRITRKLYKHKRRFIEQQGKIKAKEIRELKEKQKNRCYWCHTDISKEYHIDHYVPLSKGGEHLIENIVLACPFCNMSKHDKDPLEFANKNGRLL